jgi:hypothetical protein
MRDKPMPKTTNRTPLKAGQSIIYQGGLEGGLTKGNRYTVLEDEYVENNWRIIRVTCDDGVARKVPPQVFANEDGEVLGCPDTTEASSTEVKRWVCI